MNTQVHLRSTVLLMYYLVSTYYTLDALELRRALLELGPKGLLVVPCIVALNRNTLIIIGNVTSNQRKCRKIANIVKILNVSALSGVGKRIPISFFFVHVFSGRTVSKKRPPVKGRPSLQKKKKAQEKENPKTAKTRAGPPQPQHGLNYCTKLQQKREKRKGQKGWWLEGGKKRRKKAKRMKEIKRSRRRGWSPDETFNSHPCSDRGNTTEEYLGC